MFIDLTSMGIVQMAVVEIIDVALMTNGDMTTVGTVDMRMIGASHGFSLPGD